ncbi:VOC family protein [Shimazuella sp. AN120528]|uniref:VOC family protein n=1 Tax=Shimazuella soli TaxID=1892854 RepID=UPI001F1030C4|nr:VOC family protein [Shimazuella soli]MCH5585439.1 VOC family protein [Shimazuella soli]
MAIQKLEHVGIMVQDLEQSIAFYRDVIGMEIRGTLVHTDPSITLVFLSFPSSSETEVELIHGYKNDLPKEGVVHHLAFAVDNIEKEIERLKQLNVPFADEEITILPNGAKYIFFYGPDKESLELFESPK